MSKELYEGPWTPETLEKAKKELETKKQPAHTIGPNQKPPFKKKKKEEK